MQLATEHYFLGSWLMTRIIENVREGVIGEFWGDAVFSLEPGGVICRETGVMRFGGADHFWGWDSFWTFGADDEITVANIDGEPFHSFLSANPISIQLLGEDRYEVAYNFEPRMWNSRWEIHGPDKYYYMTTHYRRAMESYSNISEVPLVSGASSGSLEDAD